MLTKFLTESGFDDVMPYDWKEYLPESFDDYSKSYLPHKDFDNGRLMSLNLVATKKKNTTLEVDASNDLNYAMGIRKNYK